jgi:hypothetical protein
MLTSSGCGTSLSDRPLLKSAAKNQNFRSGKDRCGLFSLPGQGNRFKGAASLFKNKQRKKTGHRQASKVCEEA